MGFVGLYRCACSTKETAHKHTRVSSTHAWDVRGGTNEVTRVV